MEKRKVVLVDDEVTILEGFRKLVDWEAHGFTVVGTANDGMVALRLLEEVQPDLAVVDINIPILSGLQVIARAKLTCPGTTFVIVSGYDEFSYAQQAVKLQTVDYILKPVDFDAFAEFLDGLYRKWIGQESPRPEPEIAADNSGILPMITYLNNNLDQRISLKHLADTFHMNPTYLSQYFKAHTGVNYHDYLTGQRVAKAQKLLLSTSMSITDIAREVGFTSYRIFSSTFKRITGVTPSLYRNRQINK